MHTPSGSQPVLGHAFAEALAFAHTLHLTQFRKGTAIPYISHLLTVASLVLEDGGTEEEAIAALLHDSIEDQGSKFDGGPPALCAEIQKRFGSAVLDIVRGCTDADTHPKPPWGERKQRYIEHLRHAAAPTLRVSCADKLHNIRCIIADYRQLGEKLWERFNPEAGPVNTLWYYEQLSCIFTTSLPSRLSAQLAKECSTLRRLLLDVP